MGEKNHPRRAMGEKNHPRPAVCEKTISPWAKKNIPAGGKTFPRPWKKFWRWANLKKQKNK
jgi:hypothetical protein